MLSPRRGNKSYTEYWHVITHIPPLSDGCSSSETDISGGERQACQKEKCSKLLKVPPRVIGQQLEAREAVKKKTYQDNGHTLELTRRSRARKERWNPAKPSRRSGGVNLSEGRLLRSIKEPAQQGVSVRGRRRRFSVAITDSRATFPPRK